MKAKKRMKMIPHCYRKRGPRNPSNYSLSQLLEIGAFKKQINDLKTNNRLLSNALQESRIEAASQSNLLKDYARDTNQILFARIKLHEMAKNLAKFASDLEEVRNCLDIGLPAEYNFLQKKGSSSERIIKVPDVSCIEEEPELFENEDSDELSENPPDVSESILEENVTSVNHDIEMTPILFPGDVQEIKKKRSGSVDKGSLTPQLNIDLVCFKQKRSTISREKTPSLGRKRSTSRGLVTQINVVSTPQMPQIQDLVEMKEVLKSPSPLGRKISTSRGLVTQVNAVSPPQMCQAHDPVEVSQILKSSSIRRKRSTPGGLFTHIDAVSPPQISQEQNPVEVSEVLKSPPGRERSKSRGLVTRINAVSPPQMLQEQNPVEISEALKSPSPGRKRSRSRRLVTHINAVSPPQMSQEQNPVEISDALKSPSPGKKRSRSRGLVTHINDVSPPQMHQVQDPIEMNKIVIKIPLENLSHAGHGDSSMIQSFDLILNDKKSNISNIDTNQPSKINEVCPLQPQINDNNSPFVAVLEDHSDVHTHVQEKNENFVDDVFYPENNSQKLTDISQNTSSALNDVQLPKINEYDAEIQNVGSLTFCDSDEDENDDQKKSPVSPLVRLSRSKKPLKFTDFFLSDEDDTDTDSPFLPVTKRYGTKKIKLYSTSTGKSCEKTSTENADEISSVAIKEIAETDYSVYNLDVSNSKKAGKKHKKKPSAKSQSKKLNDKPKPLFQKCSVVKLKGGKLKFSKCEKAIEQKPIDKPPEKSMQNSCVSPGGILKRSSLMLTCEDKKHETPLKEIRNIDNFQDSKQQSMLQTPKRVSFAPTDLICKFQKMSESKAIADNKKVRRTSKSAIDLKELFEKADQSKTPPADTGNLSENTYVQNPGSVLFNLSDDTELYTFTFPSNIQYPSALPIDDVDTSKPPTPKITDKKVKHSSRSAIDLKELVEKTDQFKTPPAVTSTSSENKNAQKLSSIPFVFSADTENFLILPTNDIATSKTSISKISDQAKLVNNKSSKCMEKSPTMPSNPENIGKLSLKGNDIADKASSEYSSVNSSSCKNIEKSPISLNSPKNIQKLSLKRNKIVPKTAPECNSNIISVSETAREITDILLLESPVSLVKAPKRKSLFKESSDGGSKENLNIDQLVTEKKDSLKNKKSTLSTPKVGIKKSSCSKSQTKVHSKVSAKKNKKNTLETKSVEQSPVLADATNTIVESHSRRRSKQVSYKEPSLNKKVRRGDTFFQAHS